MWIETRGKPHDRGGYWSDAATSGETPRKVSHHQDKKDVREESTQDLRELGPNDTLISDF